MIGCVFRVVVSMCKVQYTCVDSCASTGVVEIIFKILYRMIPTMSMNHVIFWGKV